MIRKTDSAEIAPYLKDASNTPGGFASGVLIPESVEELTEFLKNNKEPITIAGAGTGLTASRIPNRGWIISLERFNEIGPIREGTIEVGPAVTLKDLQDHLQCTEWFYPPNPTETWASLGGTMATNASGSRSYKFGVSRDYIDSAEIVLAKGSVLNLTRDNKIDHPLSLATGEILSFPATEYESPHCKNAAGYFVRRGMDWLDLFVGSDGTLGIFTKLKLRLLKRPAQFLSAVLFFPEAEDCWNLIEVMRSNEDTIIDPCSLEYFDSNSLIRLKTAFPNIPEEAGAALFFEQDVEQQSEFEHTLEVWFDFLSENNVLLDDSWFAETEKDVQRFHEFRHELPQIINEENSRMGRVKLGTDMAVGNDHFLALMQFYDRTLKESGLDYVAFGHIGDNHLHINLLPGESEKDLARKTYQTMVERVLEWNGTVSAEHGIGKLKKTYFAQMAGAEALEDLRRIKLRLDPHWLLGIGNIFDP